jgi:hypothetical protein
MNTNTPKLIAYYDRDDYGSYGWWEEGDTRDEIERQAWIGAGNSDFSSIPNFTYIEVAKLSDLSEDEWYMLEWQWSLAHRKAWTSSEVDAAIRLEHDRRSA